MRSDAAVAAIDAVDGRVTVIADARAQTQAHICICVALMEFGWWAGHDQRT